jgi:hypothetical protein
MEIGLKTSMLTKKVLVEGSKRKVWEFGRKWAEVSL